MTKSMKGAILLLILGIIAILAYLFAAPFIEESYQKATSDSYKTKGDIVIAMDSWIGYFPLCGKEMKMAMRKSGYNLKCQNDNANYDDRMKNLKEAKIDFAVNTVDSNLLNGAKYGYPGVIVMIIDESKGGDAILARTEIAKNLNDLKGKDFNIAFTPASPSHHLLKLTASHFDIPELLPFNKNRIETEGSEEALKKLLTGKADVAAMWEPEVSKALKNNGIVKLLGTEEMEKAIVDILVVNRDFLKKEQELVQLLLVNYFKTLKKYKDNPELLKKHISQEKSLEENTIDSMLKGVRWVNLTENCQQWFGIRMTKGLVEEGLINNIESTTQLLLNQKDFSKNPIPDEDPYRLINSKPLENLALKDLAAFAKTESPDKTDKSSLEARFTMLSDEKWQQLQEVGTLKIEPIVFQRGTANLSDQGKIKLNSIVSKLKHYPKFRILIKGHTSPEGDREANKTLSRERAESVKQYLRLTFNIDPNRTKALGFGGENPLIKKANENLRAYKYRLSRVEISLVREIY